MALIYLTKGIITLVDDRLYDELSKHKWYAADLIGGFRPARRLRDSEDPERRLMFIYYQVLGIYPWDIPGRIVDHRDRDTLNNTRENLRITTQTENMRNTDRHINRVGVSFDKLHGKWKAYLDRPGLSRVNLGTCKTEEEAQKLVLEARERTGYFQ